MAKMMVLGVKGEAGLWLVDFEAGTVTAMDGNREDYMAERGHGVENEGTVDVAVAFETKDSAFAGHFFKASAADVAVAFETQEAAFSGHFFKTSSAEVAVAFETKEPAFSGHFFQSKTGVNELASAARS